MIELAIALGGAVVGALIAIGVHKKEHEIMKEESSDVRRRLDRHDERLDGHDIMFASIQPTLDYLVKAVDRNYEATQELKAARQ